MLSYVVPTIGVSEHLARCLASIYRDSEPFDAPAEVVIVWQAPAAADAEGPAALRELCRRLQPGRPGAVGAAPRIVELPRPAGFARAANEGMATSTGEWIALVNDDVVLEEGWGRQLLKAAAADSRVAAAQGINLMPPDDDGTARVDGAGLYWTRRWQAVQLGRGETVETWAAEGPCSEEAAHRVRRRPRRLPPEAAEERAGRQAGTATSDESTRCARQLPHLGEESTHRVRRRPRRPPPEAASKRAGRQAGTAMREESAHAVYGVSATAAIYSRAALVEVSGAGEGLRPFDERLDSYYEDVELADRLHRAGHQALLVPAARAEHAGALSSRSPRAARRRTRRVYANRLLVLARRLGRGYWPRLPGLLGRDVVDALRRPGAAPMPGDLEPPSLLDLVVAWGRAARLLPRFAHFGRMEGRSEACASRVLKPPPAAAGGDAGAPSVSSLQEDGGGAGAASASTLRGDGGEAGVPVLTAVAPHWHDEEHLAELVRDWPADERFELIVVDNGSDGGPGELAAGRSNVRVLDPGRNLGFAAAVNRGAAQGGADLVLILNPDAAPQPGALEALVQGIESRPGAAGLAPRLVGADGGSQAAWQLRRLPGFGTLVGYCCFVEPAAAPAPPAGTPVEQPAACALLLRRAVFESAGGMDERFWPAWFEDVDLARRLADRSERVLYWPEAVFRHGLGGSVPRLGYGGFLAAYYRNLDRYARRHHGRGAALLLRAVLIGAAAMRILVLPLRCPRRARSRGEAFVGLWRLAVGAAAGWRGR